MIAGLLVAVLLVPQAVAYAQLAGLSPAAGLYASMLPLVVYALMGAHASVSVGPVALVSIVVAETLAGTSLDLGNRDAAALLTLLVGAILVAGGLLRLGFLVRFVSEPVVTGFTAAAAILIAASQLGPLAGVELARGSIIATLGDLASKLGDVHAPTLMVSITALTLFVAGTALPEHLVRRRGEPGIVALVAMKSVPLAIIVAMVVTAFVLDWPGRGIEMVGELTVGLPQLTLPPVDVASVRALLPAAIAIAVIIFVVATGVAGTLGDGGSASPDREALALGAANIAGAASGGYAIGASFSRSALAASAGASTPLTLAVTAILVLAVVLLAGEVFAWLPRGVLGALIISAVGSLIDFRAILRVWSFSRAEALTLFATAGGVLFTGLMSGIAIGAAAGMALYLYGTSRPRIVVEGRVTGADELRSAEHDDVEDSDDRVLILRIDENLFFANALHFETSVRDELDAHPDATRLVIDFKSVDEIDYTALKMLERLFGSLVDKGIVVRIASAKEPVWRILKRFGVVAACGAAADAHYKTDSDALDAVDSNHPEN